MKVERMETLGVNVKNLDEAIRFFSDLLGITFVKRVEGASKREVVITEHADRAFEEIKLKNALDRTGFLELIESDPPVQKEGIRSIHFKVPDIEEAKAEMKRKGIRLIKDVEFKDVKLGGLKEAIFHPDDVYGIRLCLVEYEAPTLVDSHD